MQLVIDKWKENIMSNGLNRRKFFGLAALTTFGAVLFSKTPLKYFDKEKKIILNKKVKLHTSAVKRNK